MPNQGKRKLGRGVAMVGAGMSKFGVRNGINNRDMFLEAFNDMKSSVDKGIDTNDIEALWLGNCGTEMWESQLVVAVHCGQWIGLSGKPAIKVEAACASGSTAIRQGMLAIASGMYDVVLAGGVEKMTTLSTNDTTTALASGSDTAFEAAGGFTFPGLYAAMANAYMHEYGIPIEEFRKVAIKNHRNGALNPKAHFSATIPDIMAKQVARCKERGQPVPEWADELEFLADDTRNPVIAWPMKLYDCSPVTDGAACVLLVAEEIARNFTDNPIYIIGSGHACDEALHARPTLTGVPAAKIAAQQAYEMAGASPQDIKMAEVHDCFTIAEVMAIADLGFFEPGVDAARAAGEGRTARDGIKPINPSGGLKSKGHPVGASGAGQLVEIFVQMRGEAGARQIPDRDIDLALTHNVGAHGTTAVVQIYERR